MRKTIIIGDKYKPLMDFYSNKFDKEEFNQFVTKLLVCYKKMKDKNIDIITFSELTEGYDIDIFDLLNYTTQQCNKIDSSSMQDAIITKSSRDKKGIEVDKNNYKAKHIKENVSDTNISEKASNSITEKEKSMSSKKENKSHGILGLGVDLSG